MFRCGSGTTNFMFCRGVTMVIVGVPEEHSVQNGDEQSFER